MKQQDFKKYTSDELRDIVNNLKDNKLDLLPEEIVNFLNKKHDFNGGNPRAYRCNVLINNEIVTRFYNKTL